MVQNGTVWYRMVENGTVWYHCTILYHGVLFCIIYCIILYHVLYCIILYHQIVSNLFYDSLWWFKLGKFIFSSKLTCEPPLILIIMIAQEWKWGGSGVFCFHYNLNHGRPTLIHPSQNIFCIHAAGDIMCGYWAWTLDNRRATHYG